MKPGGPLMIEHRLIEKMIGIKNDRITLIEKHQQGRKLVADIIAAKESYLAGNTESLTVMIKGLKALAAFYPEQIRKEDAVFFPCTENYFTKGELDGIYLRNSGHLNTA